MHLFIQKIKKNRIAYYLIIPALICMILVHILPMLWGFIISFSDLDLYTISDWSKAPFIGVGNYLEGLDINSPTGGRFLRSLWNITYYGIAVISIGYLLED
jgi:multiple sugar transport system permease protein